MASLPLIFYGAMMRRDPVPRKQDGHVPTVGPRKKHDSAAGLSVGVAIVSAESLIGSDLIRTGL
jgi:hypothetical protein